MYPEPAAGIVPPWDKRKTSDERWEAPPFGRIRRSILRRSHLKCGRGKTRAARQGRAGGRSGETDAAPAGRGGRPGAPEDRGLVYRLLSEASRKRQAAMPRPELTFLLQGEQEPMSIMRRRTDPDEFDI